VDSLLQGDNMYWAYKKQDGHIVVQDYQNIDQIKEVYEDWTIAKIIMPFEAEDIKEAAIHVGNRLEAGRFLLMETQKNGLEIPRRFSYDDSRKESEVYKS
jgi:hypothetical protein